MEEQKQKYDDMYKRAMKGKLSEEEVDSIVAELVKLDEAPDPDALVAILCYTEPTEHKQRLVEKYLNGPDDMVAMRALWVLCSCWNLSEQYIDSLLWFMDGARWDFDEDCKATAITCAGIHLRRHTAPKLLRRIVELLGDGKESDRIRISAYRALVDISGGDISKVPVSGMDFSTIDPTLMKLAWERLEREEGG